MTDISWLRALDCPLLQPNAEDVDPLSQRLVQRLLELALLKQGSDELAKSLLDEIAAALRAEQATVWEVQPEPKARWSYLRRGGKPDPIAAHIWRMCWIANQACPPDPVQSYRPWRQRA